MGRYFDAKITEVWRVTPYVVGLNIERMDGEPFKVMPGQFLMMHFDHSGEKMNRSYSISNPVPLDRMCQSLELCIALVDGGVGSAIVDAADVGTTWNLSGPHGRFVLRGELPKHINLIATGTGIAPYRSMLTQIESYLEEGHVVRLVMGARDMDGFLFDDEFLALEESNDGFEYYRCGSRVSDPVQLSRERDFIGRVQAAVDTFDTEDSIFYLCGNEHMVDQLKESLQERGVERKLVRTEAYVSP